MDKLLIELREKAKAAGIKHFNMKGIDRLQADLSEIEEKPVNEPKKSKFVEGMPGTYETEPEEVKLEVIVSEAELSFLTSIGLESEWLEALASEYGFTKFKYMHKFRAFRCFIGDRNVDWISVNDLGLLHGQRMLTEIKIHHQYLSAQKAIIKLPWRDTKIIKINDPSMR